MTQRYSFHINQGLSLMSGDRDGSRICNVFHSDFHLVSLDFFILQILLMLIQHKRGKSTLSFRWLEISYLEGNQWRLLQIKPIRVTFLKRALSTGAPEWKAPFHATTHTRLSSHLECPQPLLIYISNFREGTIRRIQPSPPPHQPDQERRRSW